MARCAGERTIGEWLIARSRGDRTAGPRRSVRMPTCRLGRPRPPVHEDPSRPECAGPRWSCRPPPRRRARSPTRGRPGASPSHVSSCACSSSLPINSSTDQLLAVHAVILRRNAGSPPPSDPRQLHRWTSWRPRYAWPPGRATSYRSSSTCRRAVRARSPDESGHHVAVGVPGSAPGPD